MRSAIVVAVIYAGFSIMLSALVGRLEQRSRRKPGTVAPLSPSCV